MMSDFTPFHGSRRLDALTSLFCLERLDSIDKTCVSRLGHGKRSSHAPLPLSLPLPLQDRDQEVEAEDSVAADGAAGFVPQDADDTGQALAARRRPFRGTAKFKFSFPFKEIN